jgi:hypothetical protein
VANHGAIQDDCADPDQNSIFDRAGVEHCLVPAVHFLADAQRKIIRDVQHCTILDIGSAAYGDGINIGAYNRLVPNAGLFSERHSSDQDCRRRNEASFRHAWCPASKAVQAIRDAIIHSESRAVEEPHKDWFPQQTPEKLQLKV